MNCIFKDIDTREIIDIDAKYSSLKDIRCLEKIPNTNYRIHLVVHGDPVTIFVITEELFIKRNSGICIFTNQI